MQVHKKRFAELLNALVHHIAIQKGGRQKYEVTELALANQFHVSQSTVQTWRQGKHIPSAPQELAEQMVRFGVQAWGMDRHWADALLRNMGNTQRGRIMSELFPDLAGAVQPDLDQDPNLPSSLESPETPVPLHSPFYIERLSDRHALAAIAQQGVTLTIKGPAKMGKTSLLYRVRAAAEAQGKRTIGLNLREFDSKTLDNADAFFRQFCRRITEELELVDKVDEHWSRASTNPANCRRYLIRHVLQEIDGSLVLAIENVDTIFAMPYRTDFFGMLRSWHDDSQYRPIWRRLDRVLVTSTEPYQFIADINRSPFNVGEIVALDDFSYEQVAELNRLHAHPFTESDIKQLMNLLNGHPYLVRRAFYLVAQGYSTTADLFTNAASDRGPFRDHLAALLADLVEGTPELRQALKHVIAHHACPDHQIFFRLRGAGLVRRERVAVYPRCRLYATFFAERIHD